MVQQEIMLEKKSSMKQKKICYVKTMQNKTDVYH